MALLSDEPPEGDAQAEAAFLAGLESSGREWRAATAARVAKTAVMPAAVRSRVRVRVWLPVAAVVVLAVGAVGWWQWRQSHTPPLALLAKAYTEHRPMDLRIPGAAYGELRVERGGGRRPGSPELLESEAILARNLPQHSTDAEWLRAQGRAHLLEGQFEEAIRVLELAAASSGGARTREYAEAMVDLASAYAGRGDRLNQPGDYAIAADKLGAAIRADRSLAVAWFNRALVEERMPDYSRAVADWKKFLELEPSGAWADEARRRLAGAEGKI